ncbi:hypothetical protein EI94DRAFT_1701975 [Lactarius quietus]|nr:hypothetical protein EI94DRAFT_1701975 [Lactarius quietus]
MAICLPFEILTAIFGRVDDVRGLYNARKASRTLCAAATPFAFRVLYVSSTAGSAKNLGRLFDVSEIAAHVKEVAFHDTDADSRKLMSEIRGSAIPELASSFSRVHQLPQLETIDLTFFPADGHWRDDDFEGRLTLQSSILGALADSFGVRVPAKLACLSLHNLHSSGVTPLESPPFQTVMKNLRFLQLFVIDSDNVRIGPDNPLVHFWGTFCRRQVLVPTQESLTELTLHSLKVIGAAFELSLAELHFPHLCALSLCKIVFEPSVCAENFILRHAATLTRLELIGCMLPIYTDMITVQVASDGELMHRPTYWGPIWESFAMELIALVKLHIDVIMPIDSSHNEYWYVRPMHANFYRLARPPSYIAEVDAAALERLHMTVAARSKEARGAF